MVGNLDSSGRAIGGLSPGWRAMRIVISTQVFPPEMHPTAIMVEQLAAHLASRSIGVTVAAGYPHHPHGSVLGGYRKKLLLREARGGFEVRRGWHFTSSSPRTLTRAIVMASQAVGTVVAGVGAVGTSAVVNFGPPLLGPLVSALLARVRGARFVPVIYDLYPDVAIETGRVRNRLVIWAARKLERFVYRQADRIVVLSEGFRRMLIRRGVPASKIEIVPVWLDPSEITPSDRANRWRREMGIPTEVRVVLYAGTIGLVSGAEILVSAAESMRERSDVLFLFVGEGRVKDDIEQESRRRGLDNVRFVPFQPRERLNEVQASADVSVVTLAPGRGLTSVPSKVVGYMAAGRPVVAGVDQESDTAAAIREAKCGIVTRPGEPIALANAIAALLDDPRRREAMGRASRSYFERTYSKDAALAKMTRILESTLDRETETRCAPTR